jgi:hypothetical protein
MPHSTYRPELMGHVGLTPTGSFEAGSTGSFTLTYTAGKFGVDDLGSIKIAFRDTTDMEAFQLDEPGAPAYTTVEASTGARLNCRAESRRNIRPWGKSLYIQVAGGYLRAGDRITVRFGDTRFGSPGIRLPTFVMHAFEFRVLADPFATYDYVELPDPPKIRVVPGPPAVWKAVLPTLRRPGEPFRLSLKAEDRWGNPSDRVDATVRLRASLPVADLPETVTFRPGQRALVLDGLRSQTAGDLTVDLLDPGSGEVLAISNPLRLAADAPLRHFWADLHGQSEETVGNNTARDYFTFARDLAFLDVTSHQGNDFQITPEFWRELNELTAEFDRPGRFVAIPGYEWSGNTGLGGDRNVWFRREDRPIRRSCHALVAAMADEAADCHTANDLFKALTDEDVVMAAHVGGRYADLRIAHDGRIEHAVEIHSAWGTFEWLLRDAFELGHRVGILCNSDGHKGRPGASYPGASIFGALGGLTCFLAPELTRDAIFEALRRRHHYGTTGTRLVLDVRARFDSPAELFERDPAVFPDATGREASEALMGDIARTRDDAITLGIDVASASPIERIELRDGVEVLETVRPYAERDLGARVRVIWEGAAYRGRGREVVWDGKARITDNRILRTRSFNAWNPDRPLRRTAEGTLAWQALTSGNFGGFDLWLADATSGSLAIETAVTSCKIPIAEIGFEDRVVEAGGLGRRLRLFRLPDVNPHTAVSFERRVSVRARGDTRLFVCVTLEDGHQAWSSPIYLFGSVDERP